MSGMVYLVGAGPGDPELITLRGLRVLRKADVVVYDRLVAPELLAEARPDAERIYVGKASGAHTLPQAAINALLVAKAQAGAVVCRLKGGDPFVFGRGGEEAADLAAAGVPFRVVPGVTAGIAGPAHAGIPVTHRGVAPAVTLVTGHAGEGASEPDWAWLAAAPGTVVFYMGLSRLTELTAQLIAHGRDAGTPAAVVAWATTPQQRSVAGSLATVAADAATAGLGSPAVLVVGEAVALQPELAWFTPNGGDLVRR